MSLSVIVDSIDLNAGVFAGPDQSPQENSGNGKERLVAILEATSDVVSIADIDYQQFLFLNRAGRSMLGVGFEENLSVVPIKDFQPAWAWERLRSEGIPAVLRDGEWTGETAFSSRDGKTIIVSQQITGHRSPEGIITSLSTIARDITDRKQAEDALQRSEEMFRIITENASELIALVDRTGKRLYNSPSYQTVLGYSPEELQGTLSLDQTHPDDRAKIVEAAEKAKKSGVGKSIEYRMRHKDGSWRTLESRAGVIRNARGEIENILIVARDVTERKRAEQDKELMEVQLRHAQKMESIGQLAAGVAHEINTPIQYIGDNNRFLSDAFSDLGDAIQKFQQLLEAGKANTINPELLNEVEEAVQHADLDYLRDEIPSAIQQSLEGVDRVAKIVAAMKEFSHPGTEEKSSIDLNKAIDSTITVARNEWKYVAEVVTDFDASLPMVPCLPGEFNQVILNLIVNAAHAIADVIEGQTDSKGTIRVSTRNIGEQVEVRIIDTGGGIPEKLQSRIFEPFFTTKQVGKGTGQGLAIAHSTIVDKHGGTIELESEIGKGTTFIIRLPISHTTANSETPLT